MPKQGLRRAFQKNTSSSQSSEGSHRSESRTDEDSYLTSDRGSSLSSKSKSSLSYPDPKKEENSFITSASASSNDGSFYTASDHSNTENVYSPASPPRKQPLRLAKTGLNTPAGRYASTSKSKTPSALRTREKSTPLAKCKNDDERALLLACYPELADEEEDEEEEELNQPIFDISEEENSPVSSNAFANSSTRCSSASDSSFERYLKLLKGGNKTDVNRNELETSDGEDVESDEDGFIVSDSESIYILSDDDSVEESGSSASYEQTSDSNSEKEEKKVQNIVIRPKAKVLSNLINAFNSPSVKTKTINGDDHFFASLSANFKGVRHSEAVKFVANGIKNKKLREELTDKIFEILKSRCFDDQIDMERKDVVWNARLLTTAGLCKNNLKNNTSTIELSVKVCTTPERLRDTLVHEMCHAATWLIDSQVKAGHGPWWQRWTRRCLERCPSLPPVGVCHSYKIEKKFIYECNGCGQKIGRHSKSFKTEKFICGVCKGRFVLTKNGQPLTGTAEPSKINKFAAFVKENYGVHKKAGIKHHEVMKILSAKWKQQSSSASGIETADEIEVDISVLSIHD